MRTDRATIEAENNTVALIISVSCHAETVPPMPGVIIAIPDATANPTNA